MADTRPPNETVPSAPSIEERALEAAYRARDSWRRNQTLWSVVAAVVVCVAGAWGFWAWMNRNAEAEANRLLGLGFVHMQNNRNDSALSAFDKLGTDHSGLPVAKASLMAGNLLFQKGDWKNAETRFRRAVEESKGLPILDGGARRGLAACLIEQERYADAAKELETVINRYSHTPIDPIAREKEDAPVDDLPGMSLPMWQLVLVKEKLNQKDEARKLAERLMRTYSGSEEASEARRWFALQNLPSPV